MKLQKKKRLLMMIMKVLAVTIYSQRNMENRAKATMTMCRPTAIMIVTSRSWL